MDALASGPQLVPIPGGRFRMGSTLEQVEACEAFWRSRLVDPSYAERFRSWLLKEVPQHEVEVKPYSIARHPVTNAEYGAFVAETGAQPVESQAVGGPGDHPVWGVSVEAATDYAAWLGATLGRTCRLPTEAEWEFAARGPDGREYPFGREWDSTLCNTVESGRNQTTAVDAFPQGASPFGVLDLAGNVEEWTSDLYEPYPGGAFIEDDISTAVGRRYHVLRGGSFALGGDLARCARRHGPHPSPQFRYRGFRVVVV